MRLTSIAPAEYTSFSILTSPNPCFILLETRLPRSTEARGVGIVVFPGRPVVELTNLKTQLRVQLPCGVSVMYRLEEEETVLALEACIRSLKFQWRGRVIVSVYRMSHKITSPSLGWAAAFIVHRSPTCLTTRCTGGWWLAAGGCLHPQPGRSKTSQPPGYSYNRVS